MAFVLWLAASVSSNQSKPISIAPWGPGGVRQAMLLEPSASNPNPYGDIQPRTFCNPTLNSWPSDHHIRRRSDLKKRVYSSNMPGYVNFIFLIIGGVANVIIIDITLQYKCHKVALYQVIWSDLFVIVSIQVL